MSGDGDLEADMDALIEADQRTAADPPHDALPSLEQVDGDDGGGGGFIVEEQSPQAVAQQKEQLTGSKRKHDELAQPHSAASKAAEADDLDDFTADDIDRLIAEHEQSKLSAPANPPPSAATSPSTTAASASAPSAILSCCECHALAYNVPYYKAYHLLVCNDCQRQHPARYQLVLKTAAQQQYLLSDADLAGLPLMLRTSRARGGHGCYKLYRRADVLDVVGRRWGSEAAMEDEKRRREMERLEKDVVKRARGRAALEKEKRVREWRMDKEMEGKGHTHTYVDVNVKGRKKQKCSSCGFTLEFEEL